jgi:hypothetical protein
MDEQVDMILQIIKQGPSKVVKEYYKRISKLTNCLQLKAYYQFAHYFRGRLLRYFHVAIVSMKIP